MGFAPKSSMSKMFGFRLTTSRTHKPWKMEFERLSNIEFWLNIKHPFLKFDIEINTNQDGEDKVLFHALTESNEKY
ncbi:uncharacterized protein L203_103935 [Cryptococcus depauperatus CBS 7841]|uniref:Uncharacterized protein n=1 Tax=Cryptococcus depauperatus CBS 7841 TaxID=1295531 RepID=A0AAJ8JUR2_9TREE